MHIKTILAGAALALAATIGSASAAEQFSTLEGVTAVAMSSVEQDAVVGKIVHFLDANGGFHVVHGPLVNLGNGEVPNGYHGLCVASSEPGISGAVTRCP